jgi:hypothetical protein
MKLLRSLHHWKTIPAIALRPVDCNRDGVCIIEHPRTSGNHSARFTGLHTRRRVYEGTARDQLSHRFQQVTCRPVGRCVMAPLRRAAGPAESGDLETLWICASIWVELVQTNWLPPGVVPGRVGSFRHVQLCRDIQEHVRMLFFNASGMPTELKPRSGFPQRDCGQDGLRAERAAGLRLSRGSRTLSGRAQMAQAHEEHGFDSHLVTTLFFGSPSGWLWVTLWRRNLSRD